ncbi:MAG: YicC/YloC family endoribonuclease [Gammaproteobacteria bacterium]
MIKSMTAFAGYEAEVNGLTINCEMRSVNHRYSDISVKLPERLRFLESEIRALIGAKINRGKIECLLSYKKQARAGFDFIVNPDALKSLMAAVNQIEQQMPAPGPFSALDVLAFPGVQQEPDADKETLVQNVIELVAKTLSQLSEVRCREGAELQTMIQERCIKMQGHVAAAKKRMPEVLELLRNRLKDRIDELVAQPDYDRLEQELVMLTQKLDIAEELDRLDTHINEVLRVLERDEPVGRRLDFLMQELHREANTMGSKSADKETTQISIELKVLIEQMREQIQNME